MEEFVVMTAVHVEAPSRRAAHDIVQRNMPKPGEDDIESWWITEDDRSDGSDQDSTVFVVPGCQRVASQLLYAVGLTHRYNVMDPSSGQFPHEDPAVNPSLQEVKERLLEWLAEPAKGI